VAWRITTAPPPSPLLRGNPIHEAQNPAHRAPALAALTILACVTATTALPGPALADAVTANQAWRIAQQYTGVWTSPPTTLTNGETVDAPLLGNGDIGVAVGGSIANQTMYLGKNDFFSGSSHAIKPLGRIVLSAAGLSGASYRMVQDHRAREVRGTYALGGQTLTTTSWVDANSGLFVTSFTLTGGSTQSIGITLQNGSGGTPSVSTTGNDWTPTWPPTPGPAGDPHARIAARTIGQTQSISGNRDHSHRAAGRHRHAGGRHRLQHRQFLLAGRRRLDRRQPRPGGRRQPQRRAPVLVADLLSQSYVEIPDKTVEKSWYGSLYLLGCVSRAGKFAPGLVGNWITGT